MRLSGVSSGSRSECAAADAIATPSREVFYSLWICEPLNVFSALRASMMSDACFTRSA